MGKGDRKTRRGKTYRGSYGNARAFRAARGGRRQDDRDQAGSCEEGRRTEEKVGLSLPLAESRKPRSSRGFFCPHRWERREG
jgi:ribosomal small subunit protein bTHX